RPESQSVAEGLEGRTGVWRVLDNNVIVIAGGSPAATFEATVAFCKDVFGYEEAPDESGTVLSAGRPAKLAPEQSGEISVAFPQHLLNGTDLCEYVIVTDQTGSAVTKFANAILEASGHLPDVIAPADYKDGPALFLGYTPWAEGGHIAAPFDTYSYYAVSDGNKIAVDWKTPALPASVLADFIKVIIPGEEATSVSFERETTRLFTVTGEYNLLSLASVASQELAPGIIYTKALYKDGDGKPVRVYAVAMDKGAGRFYAGLPDDSPTEVSGRVQNVMNQIKAAVANGRKVVAGFNSGFFDMGGTGLSRGLVVKEGTVAAANTERPFFAQLKSGELLILPAGSYTTYKDSINTALAGNIILLKNGLINSISQGTDMAKTRHPRTAVGFNSTTGHAVVIEVDGRQPSVSNGASYLDLISIFRDFGCTDMINLDGGGSSTAIIRKADGTYELQNSPSDRSMRSVQDSIFIILND
ncbi:MAG: phosphodiester glycosidase family protein, partial [Clostridiales bacterium]|nr:phosphodiester glycosidase family protein [Clostridiales bacterium]